MNFLPLLIAKRLYFKQKKNFIVFFISILSKIGISISVFALIMGFSAFNGFQILLNKKILSTLPHGIIQLNDQYSSTWPEVIKKLFFFPGIVYCEPYIVLKGLLIKNNTVKLVEIKSFTNIHLLNKNFFSQNKNSNLLQKEHFNHQIIISSHLSNDLSIKNNDSIELFILNEKKNIFNSDLKPFSLKIINIFESNGILDGNIVYIPFKFFEKIFNIKNQINAIELHMSNPFNADTIIKNISKKIGIPIYTYTWIDSYKDIYNDIKKMKAIIYFILLLIIIISSFSITSISIMTISNKTQEIAILRSMGASNFLIQIIFLYYGLRYIIIGTCIGLLIGTIIVLNFQDIVFFLDKNFKNNILLDNIYYNNFLLLKLKISDAIIIFISSIVIGIIANWYPAYYASTIDPSKILKEY